MGWEKVAAEEAQSLHADGPDILQSFGSCQVWEQALGLSFREANLLLTWQNVAGKVNNCKEITSSVAPSHKISPGGWRMSWGDTV